MENITHRSAIDDITDGTSTTHCGLIFSLYDDNAPLSNSPTCEECIAKINLQKNPLMSLLIAYNNLKAVCFKCAFFDLTLSEKDQYRCHTNQCPARILPREQIDNLIKYWKRITAEVKNNG